MTRAAPSIAIASKKLGGSHRSPFGNNFISSDFLVNHSFPCSDRVGGKDDIAYFKK